MILLSYQTVNIGCMLLILMKWAGSFACVPGSAIAGAIAVRQPHYTYFVAEMYRQAIPFVG